MITTGDISCVVSPECDQKGVIQMYEDNRMIAEMRDDPFFEPPREWWERRYNGSSDHPPPPETEEAENFGQPAIIAD